MDKPMGSELARHWGLDPEIVFLNHGSFGACPTAVLEVQRQLRDRLEAEPVRFMVRELEALLDAARAELGHFLDADPAGLVFVTNATSGVNTVFASLRFAPGDELVTTAHEYNASRNALEHAAQRDGARAIAVEIPFPLESPDQVVEAILAAVTPRTRIVLADHVTSPTGLVFPIERIIAELASRGIDTLVDGAHAPGMLPLSLKSLGAAYYTGNCHKWICAPKGAAFLYVREDRREFIHPTIVSHGANSPRTDRSRFHLEFDWTGTADPTAWLSIPAAIVSMGTMLPGGWPEVRACNRKLALAARDLLADKLGIPPPAPTEMIGSLAALPLPDGDPAACPPSLFGDPLQDALLERYEIEVPVISWPCPPKRLIRISAQLYNRREQYDYLATALQELLSAGL